MADTSTPASGKAEGEDDFFSSWDKPAATKTSSSTPATPAPAPSRVVVVREKMDDLRLAARQAERDIQARKDLRRARSHDASLRGAAAVADFIDPTDVVDLPPPGAAYPFAVQASALHGLGVGESVAIV